jgi:KDO2-lipid IV(A) lauroyltransferase
MTDKSHVLFPAPAFSRSLLHPKHWPIWSLMGIWYCVSQLPYSWQTFLGIKLGHLLQKLGGARVRISKINIAKCFPEYNEQQQATLLRKNFESVGMGFIEIGLGWWGRKKQFNKIQRISGLEHIQKAQEAGRGVLVITGHFTPMEVAARILGEHIGIRLMYKKNRNAVFEWISSQRRAHYTTEMIPHKAVQHFLERLNAGDACIFLVDQDYRLRHSVFAPFFGIQTATIKKTAEYAKDTNAVTIPIHYTRLPNNEGYQLIVEPALDNFPTGDALADATRLNQVIETFTREAPEQYLWQHRRFKNRPEGEKPFY